MKRWTWMLLLLLLLVATPSGALAGALPVLGVLPNPYRPPEADDSVVSIAFDSDVDGQTVPLSWDFKLQTFGLDVDFGIASPLPEGYGDGDRESNVGHAHVYGALQGISPVNSTNLFLGAFDLVEDPENPNVILGHADFPVPGEWLLIAQAQYSDHTPRIGQHPQVFPAMDAVRVTVVPEPSALVLLAVGVGVGAWALRRRRRR